MTSTFPMSGLWMSLLWGMKRWWGQHTAQMGGLQASHSEPVRKVVFTLFFLFTIISQYPMQGRGHASMMVMLLRAQSSVQKRLLPTFFLAITMTDAQGLLDGHMILWLSTCSTCSSSSYHSSGFWWRSGWLIYGCGATIIFIMLSEDVLIF